MQTNNLTAAKRQFIISLVMLVAAIIYLISPIDIIPDVLFPAGYLDDIPFLLAAAVYSGISYRKMKREQKTTEIQKNGQNR